MACPACLIALMGTEGASSPSSAGSVDQYGNETSNITPAAFGWFVGGFPAGVQKFVVFSVGAVAAFLLVGELRKAVDMVKK